MSGGPKAGEEPDVGLELEEARRGLLRKVRGRTRAVVESKINLSRQHREDVVANGHMVISQSFAAKGGFNSGARLKACWSLAAEETDKATNALLAELLPLGLDEVVLARYIAADARQFLRSTMAHRVREQAGKPDFADQLAKSLVTQVDEHVSGIRDLVRSQYHDFERAQGTWLERRLRRLRTGPVVTIGAAVIGALTAIYKYRDELRKVWSAIIRR